MPRNPGIAQRTSLIEEIQPGLEAASQFLPLLANPNYQQQLALRQMVLRNPALAQELIDMGPEQVERIYGKGTGHYAQGKKSIKKRVDEAIGDDLETTLADPRSREEMTANTLGTRTSDQREASDLGLRKGRVDVTQIERTEEVRTAALGVLQQRQGKLFDIENPMPAEMAAVVEQDPDMRRLFERQRDDYWKQQQNDLRTQLQIMRAQASLNLATFKEQQKMERTAQDELLAKQIAYATGGASAREVLWALTNETDKYRNMREAPTDQAELARWRGVRAIARFESERDNTRRKNRDTEFLSQTRELQRTLRSRTAQIRAGINTSQVAAMVTQINDASERIYGFDDPNRPVYTIGVKPGSERRIGRDPITFYQERGVNPETGAKVKVKAEQPRLASIDEAAAMIASGSIPIANAEALLREAGYSTEQIVQIKARANSLPK